MRGEGQLKHQFHGRYSCVVGILFDSTKDAELACEFLPGFQLGKENPNTVKRAIYRVAHGRKDGEPIDTRTEVDETRDMIEKFRVYDPKDHRGQIDGTPFSIDYGPLFHVDFTDAIRQRDFAAKQLSLF